jgi:hypothetical protein
MVSANDAEPQRTTTNAVFGQIGSKGAAVFVGVLPGQPEFGEFFDEFGMVSPAWRDLAGEWVAAADPVDPVGELTPEFRGAVRADGAPAPGGGCPAGGDSSGLNVLEAGDQSGHGVGGLVGEGVEVSAELADELCLVQELPQDRLTVGAVLTVPTRRIGEYGGGSSLGRALSALVLSAARRLPTSATCDPVDAAAWRCQDCRAQPPVLAAARQDSP